MPTRVIQGDLLELALAGQFDLIIHGCNCMCVMGAGIAKSIKAAFPEAYAADQATTKGDRRKLGTLSYAIVTRDRHTFAVANAYTQYHWRGRGPQADLAAVRQAMKAIAQTWPTARVGYPRLGLGSRAVTGPPSSGSSTKNSTGWTTRLSSLRPDSDPALPRILSLVGASEQRRG